MKQPLPLLALAAAALIAGCDAQPETITAGGPADPDAERVANAVANVTLPPAIVASHKYRCGDNSLVSVDWKSDGKVNSAAVTAEGGAPVVVNQAEAGGDYTAEGATLKGDPQASSITFNGKSCKR